MRQGATVLLLLLALLFAPAVNLAQEALPEGDAESAAAPDVEAAVPDEPAEDMSGGEPETAAVDDAPVAAPVKVEVLDVPIDNGQQIGITWGWSSEVDPETRVCFEFRIPRGFVDRLQISERQRSRLDDALAGLQQQLASLLPEHAALKSAVDEAQAALTVATGEGAANEHELLLDYHRKNSEFEAMDRRVNKAGEKFESLTTNNQVVLLSKFQEYQYMDATFNNSPWLVGNEAYMVKDILPTTRFPEIFGHHPENPDNNYVSLSKVRPVHPGIFDGTFADARSEFSSTYNKGINPAINVPLFPGLEYEVRMVTVSGIPKSEQFSPESLYDEAALAASGWEIRRFNLGTVTPQVSYFNKSFLNNFIFSILFAIIIMSWIMVARRNPNLFIRRIQGLEAVDDAIGRATEMGKPVLYLCGLDPLSTLSTLAAVNILGRVARRIADFDSDLVVPCRDPVVLTVAQEVVKEAYLEAGRPDAYREDKIYFVTDDQFSYTATTCAIMMREKPAANFFMGYYYAESLLLAETGASTGAIQIAGTDALHQLPFFITTCDYTLIGEELYAASAYLSREPMLLGSLKGQDVSKAAVMVLIILQTLLFLIKPEWNWLRLLVEPL